jgi:CxxC motif-containing protein (DUF1111 family)
MPSSRAVHRTVATFLAALLLASSGHSQAVPPSASPISNTYVGAELPFLTSAEQSRFHDGFLLFVKTWTASEGLGPQVNAASCVTCHRVPLPGGAGTTSETLVPHSRTSTNAVGAHGASSFVVEADGTLKRVELDAADVVFRKTPALFGVGLLGAVPRDTILAREDVEDRDGDGISGRAVLLPDGTIGRFGWKGNVPDLATFVERALISEMGLIPAPHAARVPGLPVEVQPEQVTRLVDYLMFLAPPMPPPQESTRVHVRGRAVFDACRCTACHVPQISAVIGSKQMPLPAYTDLLVHDMGERNAEPFFEGNVAASEFRTPPLWGIWATGPYWHDGRSGSLDEAIARHDGEAASAAAAVRNLTQEDRDALLQFLRTL